MSDIANTGAAAPTGTGSSGATPSAPATSSPTPSSATKTSNAMTPGDFKSRMRGHSEEAFEAADPDVDIDPDADEDVDTTEKDTNFQASDDTEGQPEETSVDDSDAPEEDLSWLEALKEYKQLHGLELVDLIKALAAGQLPEELHDLIKVKMKNGDQEWESPLSKARKEAMLHHDYTNKLQALSKEKGEYYADKEEFVGMLQNWKSNPEALLDGLERLEFPVLEAAKLLAKRHRELDEMTPRERELFEAKTKLEREIAKGKYEQRRSQDSEAKKQIEAKANQNADLVSATAQQLFNKAGVPLDERTWTLFLNKFQIITNAYPPGTQWTADMIENAFEAANYDYQQALVKREKVQNKAQPAPKPKQQFDSPAREAVARLQQAPQPKKGAGGAMKPSDFRKQFLGR